MAEVRLIKTRLSYPVLFTAKEFKAGDGKPRFSASFIVEPGSENDNAVKAAIDKAIHEKFEGDTAKMARFRASCEGQKNQWCYRKSLEPETEGMMVLACHVKVKPTVVDRDKTPIPNGSSGRPYAGCYVFAICDIYVQTGDNPGLRASFSGVQFMANGDAFGSGAPASLDEFDDLSAGAGDDDLAQDAPGSDML